MKAKTAKRFLNRNQYKITRHSLEHGIKRYHGFVKTCLKILRSHAKTTHSKATISCLNNFIYR